MADKKITQLTALTGANAVAGDELVIVDINDTSMSASGTNKKITLAQLQAAPVSAGTANGVAFLNASKVLTTGSALTFDGTNLFVGGTIGAFGGTQKGFAAESGTVIAVLNGESANSVGSVGTVSNHDFTFKAYGSEQMRLTSTGLGIGTSSPATKLDVNSTAAAVMRLTRNGGTAANTALQYFNGSVSWFAGMSASGLYSIGFNDAALDSGQFRLDSSGNLGLGVTPSAWGTGKGFELGAAGNGVWGGSGFVNLVQNTAFTSGAYRYVRTATAARYEIELNVFKWLNAPSGTAGNAITFTQAMTLDASGNLLVGTTSRSDNERLSVRTSTDVAMLTRPDTNISYFPLIVRSSANATIGSILASTTSTSFNTSSDYRLKHDIAPMTGVLARVALLKPVTYKWNADNSEDEGFIAHELAEVCPGAVTGEKDAVNEDGSIKPQGIDTSFLVATLTAAIQEQQTLITALTARITALESN